MDGTNLYLRSYGVAVFVFHSRSFASLDLNSIIFLFLWAGLLLHWTPINYVRAVNQAARVTGRRSSQTCHLARPASG
jgi:short subunit fatty acids transporter